ncbi:MAG: glycosyltransferase family 2 protein [Thermoleophilia bacterium]|nr:glycosyltransferase family 2 protein [Thermoleophilia bacterium]
MSGPDVSALVVTYRSKDCIEECLESLSAGTTRARLEVVVVDNASGDGTAGLVRRAFPRARLVASPENVGFARAVNLAAGEARGEYLLLLNPDAIVHPGAVDELLAVARGRPGYGLYAGRNLNPDGSVSAISVRGRPTAWSAFCFATLLSTAFAGSRLFDPESLGGWGRDTLREVDIAIGSFLLVSRALWRELGGFDPRFFMYGEDVDLSLRAARAGRPAVFVPSATVTHKVGASTDTRAERMVLIFRGKATVVRKHWPAGKRQFGLAMLWLGVGLRALLAARARTEGGAGVWPGVWRARGTWLAGYPPQPPRARLERESSAGG